MTPSLSRRLAVVSMALVLCTPVARSQSVERAAQMFRDARFAEAKAELTALERAGHGGAAVPYYLGRIATVNGEGEEAMRLFERAVQLDEGNALYHYWLGSSIRELTPHVGVKIPIYARRMKKAFDRAVELDPEQIDARFGLVHVYASAPRGLGGNRDKARQQAAEIARRSPLQGALARGFIAQMEEKPAEEELAYQQAISAQPDSLAGYAALVEMYIRLARAAEAFATIDRYGARQPQDPMALFYVGRIAATTGQQLERGERALTTFLGAPPGEVHAATIAGAHLSLGQIAERKGAQETARAHYAEALRRDPRSRAKQALARVR